jgi:predicted nucleic acid-binding protein
MWESDRHTSELVAATQMGSNISVAIAVNLTSPAFAVANDRRARASALSKAVRIAGTVHSKMFAEMKPTGIERTPTAKNKIIAAE